MKKSGMIVKRGITGGKKGEGGAVRTGLPERGGKGRVLTGKGKIAALAEGGGGPGKRGRAYDPRDS